MRSQKIYETYVAESIARDIERLDPGAERKEISISGQMRKARAMRMAADKYPAFHYIVPVYFYNEDWIGAAYLYHFLQRELSVSKLTEEDRERIRTSEPAVSNGLYELYPEKEKLILVFPE